MRLESKQLKDLGEFLKSARVTAGISQREMAEHLNQVSPQYVSNVERGMAPPSNNYLKLTLTVYGLSKSRLLDKLSQVYLRQIKEILK